MAMEILKVNYEIGAKCYTRFNNAIRECIFMGTIGIENQKGYTISCYVLNIAGVGKKFIEFDRLGNFHEWYHGKECDTVLYPTLSDCINKTHCVTAMYGATDNCYNYKFLQPLFPECSVCNCGGDKYGWAWDGVDAVRVRCRFTSGEYKFDEFGFHKRGKLVSCGYVDSYRYCGDLGKIYPSKSACLAEHQPTIVTF